MAVLCTVTEYGSKAAGVQRVLEQEWVEWVRMCSEISPSSACYFQWTSHRMRPACVHRPLFPRCILCLCQRWSMIYGKHACFLSRLLRHVVWPWSECHGKGGGRCLRNVSKCVPDHTARQRSRHVFMFAAVRTSSLKGGVFLYFRTRPHRLRFKLHPLCPVRTRHRAAPTPSWESSSSTWSTLWHWRSCVRWARLPFYRAAQVAALRSCVTSWLCFSLLTAHIYLKLMFFWYYGPRSMRGVMKYAYKVFGWKNLEGREIIWKT
jgi:hypothetical protein